MCAPIATITSALGTVRFALPKPLRPSGPSASACVDGNASGEYCSAATGMPVRSASSATAWVAPSLITPRPTTNTGRCALDKQLEDFVELLAAARRQHRVAIRARLDRFDLGLLEQDSLDESMCVGPCGSVSATRNALRTYS